jgi:hypothetical protein
MSLTGRRIFAAASYEININHRNEKSRENDLLDK